MPFKKGRITILVVRPHSLLCVLVCWICLGSSFANGTCPAIPKSIDNIAGYERIFDEWSKLASKQYAKGRSEITRKCLAEVGVAGTLPEMIDWLKKPAEVGFIEAQVQLAYFYIWRGQSIRPFDEQHFKRAEYWLKTAYKNGSEEAGVILGALYVSGSLDEPAPEYGLNLLRTLANSDNADAQRILDELQPNK